MSFQSIIDVRNRASFEIHEILARVTIDIDELAPKIVATAKVEHMADVFLASTTKKRPPEKNNDVKLDHTGRITKRHSRWYVTVFLQSARVEHGERMNLFVSLTNDHAFKLGFNPDLILHIESEKAASTKGHSRLPPEYVKLVWVV